MNSRVSWSVDGIDPSVRERAEAAARRAGMSLSDWLNSTIGESAPPRFRRAFRASGRRCRAAKPRRRRHSPAAGFHHPADRTDFAAGRADVRAANAARSEPTVARQLNDAISRLDARLSQISNPAPTRQAQMQEKQRQAEMVERAAAQVYRPSPPLSPASMDFAIAEIAARQNELDGPPPRQMPPRNAPPIAPPCGRRRRCAHERAAAPRSGLFVARTAPAQDHQPDRGAAASRSYRAIDRRVPQRTRRNPSGHHRGDAAPGDRIDRERNPLAVAPHRRKPPERQRRPDAGRHRTRARRNPRSAALADAGRAAHRLRRGDPQSRRQARPDPALERRSLDGAAARKRDRGAARHRLQRRLQRRAGPARRRRAHAVGQGRPASPLSTATAMPSACSSSASPR